MAKDIYEVLHKEHKEARKILDKLTSTDEEDVKKRREKCHTVAIELITHHEAESKCFYKRLEQYDELKGHIAEHQQEHEEANAELKQWMQVDPSSPEWMNMLQKIKKAVDHHIEDEENELFPRVKELLSEDQAKEIADEFQAEQDSRKEHMKAA
ncbi:MAG TPA: hemerythrin domain-containing protein [Gammaproteobacteria bacterium]|nr:hemerythrin domain-containing protein [Gammaproteobacteria bacterium]